RLDPIGTLLRRALLEERLGVGAVHVALENDRPPGDATQRTVGDRGVVRREIELGVAGLGKEDLVGVRDHHLTAGGDEHGFPRLSHADTVARVTRSRKRDTTDANSAHRSGIIVGVLVYGNAPLVSGS